MTWVSGIPGEYPKIPQEGKTKPNPAQKEGSKRLFCEKLGLVTF